MNLTIDANILVDELTREGEMSRSVLMHPALERLFIAEYTWDEASHVIDNRLRSRVRSGRLTAPAADRFKTISIHYAEPRCTMVVHRLYAPLEREARLLVPGDPDDRHTIAVAMAMKTAIWTLDQKHFFGCGMTVWKMSVLRAALTAGEHQKYNVDADSMTTGDLSTRLSLWNAES